MLRRWNLTVRRHVQCPRDLLVRQGSRDQRQHLPFAHAQADEPAPLPPDRHSRPAAARAMGILGGTQQTPHVERQHQVGPPGQHAAMRSWAGTADPASKQRAAFAGPFMVPSWSAASRCEAGLRLTAVAGVGQHQLHARRGGVAPATGRLSAATSAGSSCARACESRSSACWIVARPGTPRAARAARCRAWHPRGARRASMRPATAPGPCRFAQLPAQLQHQGLCQCPIEPMAQGMVPPGAGRRPGLQPVAEDQCVDDRTVMARPAARRGMTVRFHQVSLGSTRLRTASSALPVAADHRACRRGDDAAIEVRLTLPPGRAPRSGLRLGQSPLENQARAAECVPDQPRFGGQSVPIRWHPAPGPPPRVTPASCATRPAPGPGDRDRMRAHRRVSPRAVRARRGSHPNRPAEGQPHAQHRQDCRRGSSSAVDGASAVPSRPPRPPRHRGCARPERCGPQPQPEALPDGLGGSSGPAPPGARSHGGPSPARRVARSGPRQRPPPARARHGARPRRSHPAWNQRHARRCSSWSRSGRQRPGVPAAPRAANLGWMRYQGSSASSDTRLTNRSGRCRPPSRRRSRPHPPARSVSAAHSDARRSGG